MKTKQRDIKDVAKYIGLSLISKGLSVSPLKLQKMLYYLQSWFMVFFGRDNTLFDDVPQAWVNGPVYPAVFYAYKDKTASMCDHLQVSDFGDNDADTMLGDISRVLAFSHDEVHLIESVILLYGSKSQNELIFLSHSELPWAEKRQGLEPFERSTNELSLDTMYNYYYDRHERNKKKRDEANKH